MFPSESENEINSEVKDEFLSYMPFSDGYDSGLPKEGISGFNQYMDDFNQIGSRTVSDIVGTLADQGRAVSCIIYTLLLPWAADVAREHNIPSALYWIQPASVFAIYYHFYHGYGDLVKSKLNDPNSIIEFPGLRPYKIQDLPSFITTSIDESDLFHSMYISFHKLFESLDREKTEKSKALVLINTFTELEARELTALNDLDMFPIGPLLPLNNEIGNNGDLFKPDEKPYMQWLDMKGDKSVVYISFGSLTNVKQSKLEELLNVLEEAGRPYLWVVRKDNRDVEGIDFENVNHGMVVEWCDQVKVLCHPSIGCFVTHCGWNSTLESLSCGIPMVCGPRMSDQKINAELVEEVWGVGVRAEVTEGVIEGKEMIRCLDLIMGDSGKAIEMRIKSEIWNKKAKEVMSEGGLSDRNLMAFVERIKEM